MKMPRSKKIKGDGLMNSDEMGLLLEIASEMRELRKDVHNIDSRLKRVELTVENEINRGIKLLAEGHSGLTDKIGIMHYDVEEIKGAVSILDFIQKQMQKQMAINN
jgi:hypothetical protein